MSSAGPLSFKPMPPARREPASLTAPDPIREASGSYVHLDGEDYYKISNSHLLEPFFLSLISGSDHWMFVASNGAVSAGRKDADQALFPYYSGDKILDLQSSTGPATIIRIHSGDGFELWEPFAPGRAAGFQQNLYKSRNGSRVIFEELHLEQNLAWRYSWTTSHRDGFIRAAQLVNLGNATVQVELLDGLRNVLPACLGSEFQLRYSNLADAYKRSELIREVPLALFHLNAVPSDRPLPSECLRATAVWTTGRTPDQILLSDRQVAAFRQGNTPRTEREVRGKRGSFWAFHAFALGPSDIQAWQMVADVNQDQIQITRRIHELQQADVSQELLRSQRECQARLNQRIATADGDQAGSDWSRVDRHRSNVTFNVMRGGIPIDLGHLQRDAWLNHLRTHHRPLAERFIADFADLPSAFSLDQLRQRVALQGDDWDLQRLTWEYLPLTFSRRHGDPTRPWNRFCIDLWQEDGAEKLYYEGNWRDIFQNWEALGLSYPQLFNSMLLRFVNASTRDGHNPYRITKDGLDWERPDAEDPWSNFGYWGDHQTIYQLKLIEWARRFQPQGLDAWLRQPICVFADVPYRIVPLERMVSDPRHTIEFDAELDRQIEDRVAQLGSDGQLVPGPEGPLRVTLFEKLLVSGLAQLTNLVPGAGIWLNTQRPEWNDANNALVGRGCSVVTTAYLRRYFQYLLGWLGNQETGFSVTAPLAQLARSTSEILQSWQARQEDNDPARWQLLQQLQRAAEDYRRQAYQSGQAESHQSLEVGEFRQLARRAVQMLDQTLERNRRPDGLYHAYNLIEITDGSVAIERLPEMLEGQVAILSSGKLTSAEALEVLEALRQSRLYREDQQSYLLYPDREVSDFLSRNQIAPAAVAQSELLSQMLASDERSVVRQDANGIFRFASDLQHAGDLAERLDQLAASKNRWSAAISRERAQLIQLFEETFEHGSYTGRSGTFFAYEGLGSIYWHMVSKLLLAVQENLVLAHEAAADVRGALHAHYREIRAGLGVEKSPAQYGAFPIDPYSHTPAGGGARQPGMTGQVKEDILVRFTELGVRIRDGQLEFRPELFERHELLQEPQTWNPGNGTPLRLQPREFGFTYCGLPIVYQVSETPYVEITFADGRVQRLEGLALTADLSASIFERRGTIDRLQVGIGPGTA